jgi:hypothetical protein
MEKTKDLFNEFLLLIAVIIIFISLDLQALIGILALFVVLIFVVNILKRFMVWFRW